MRQLAANVQASKHAQTFWSHIAPSPIPPFFFMQIVSTDVYMVASRRKHSQLVRHSGDLCHWV